MTITEGAALFSGTGAAVAVFVHIVVYANKEGRKEQRLLAVEERVKGLPGIEVMLATLTTSLGGVQHQLGDLKSDLQEINSTIRNHLFGPK